MNRQLKGLSKQKIKTSSITINFELSACRTFSHYDITLSDFVVQISDFTRNDISNVHVAIRSSVQRSIFLQPEKSMMMHMMVVMNMRG